MALTLSRRILRFNFDPLWFGHPSRLADFGVVGLASADLPLRMDAANQALRSLGLSGRWCFNFDWMPGRLALLSSAEADWVLPQLAVLALPEFRTLVVRREERDWIRSLPAAEFDGAAGVGDVFREQGEFRPSPGLVRDVRTGLRRYGAALWLALGRGLGDAGMARMKLMLDPTLEAPSVSLDETQSRLLYHGFASCIGPQIEGEWSWLR